jgi:hypothetical protein
MKTIYIMSPAARAVAIFFRLAFFPLSVSLLVVLLLQPIYYMSLASLGYFISRQATAEHLTAAFKQGILSDDGSPRGIIWKGGEQLTECISLGIGLNKSEVYWESPIAASYPVFGSAHECEGLHRAVSNASVSWQPYFRYWHGYRVILSPLVALFPFWLVKVINGLMIAAAFTLLWATVRNRCDATVATILLVTFICLSDILFIWRTSTHSLSLAYILAGASLFAMAMDKNLNPRSLIVVSAILGSGFNFIDFLINPPLMPMVIAFFIVLSDRLDTGMLAVSVVVAWFVGYSETWVAKWALAYLAMPSSAGVVSDVLSSIEVRTIGVLNGVYLVPLAATVRAFLRALNRVGVIVPLILLLAIAHYGATVSRIHWRRALWLWCPAIVSVLWFEALSSHTQWHLTVSSRSAAMAIAIFLSGTVISMERRPSIAELWAQLGILRSKILAFRRSLPQ